jgi:hypothetical protein
LREGLSKWLNQRRHSHQKNAIDPITLEVIRNGIISICDQIDANMPRTIRLDV